MSDFEFVVLLYETILLYHFLPAISVLSMGLKGIAISVSLKEIVKLVN